MELKDTVEGMLSSDYKERFKAEYQQLEIRSIKLGRMLANHYAGKLDFEPSCPIHLLAKQHGLMGELLRALRERAQIEGIDLDD